MTKPIQATNSTEKPSGLKRAFYTLMPCPAATYEIGKALAEGKTAKEAWAETKKTFEKVQQGNREQYKENIHNMAELSEKMGAWKYILGATPLITAEAFDKTINNQ